VSSKGWVTLVYLARPAGRRQCSHRIHYETRDPEVAGALQEFGIRPAKPSKYYPRRWRVEAARADYEAAHTFATRMAAAIGAPLMERYAFTVGKSWNCTPATQVFPGLQVPVVRDGCVTPEEIVRVTRRHYDGPVYDLTVMDVHNYVAGGVLVHNSIYRFRRADVRLFQELKRRMPHEGRLDLTRNFRSQPAV